MTSRANGFLIGILVASVCGPRAFAQAPPPPDAAVAEVPLDAQPVAPPPPLPLPPQPGEAAPAPNAAAAPPPAGAPPSAAVPPPSAAPAPAPDGAPGGIAELEAFIEPFIYDIQNRRDPFQPYAEYVPVDDQASGRALSPAQRWDLEKLKLIGIMWDIKDPKAMFLDPEQDVMILGRDESIGNKSGYIAAIREGEVVVVEAIRKRGDITYRTRVLRIER